MNATAIVFYALAGLACASAFMVIWSRNVMHSALYLVPTFLSVAAIYVMLRAEFVAAVQVLVYAGGILVLFLFVIMLVNVKAVQGARLRLHGAVSGSIGAASIALLLSVYGRGRILAAAPDGGKLTEFGGNLETVGWVLYNEYLLPFEIASLFLLVAMVGAIVLARHKA